MIIHNQQTDIFPIEKNEFLITIWVDKKIVKSVTILYCDRYLVDSMKSKEMRLEQEVENFDVWQVAIKTSTNRLLYKFLIKDIEGKIFYYTQYGIAYEEDLRASFFHYPYVFDSDVFKKPNWIDNLVIYEIFPDRFARVDNEVGKTYLYPWDYKKWENGGSQVFLGGNFKGIMSKMDYFKDLGINCIYFTPLFKSTSSHRYNVDDYFIVDPLLGTNEEFKDLVDLLHKNGIKVIVDMVFNHTGGNFKPFQDLLENGENSAYKDWFYPYSFPVDKNKINYETFANNIAEMPKINTSNAEVQEYFISVLKYWMNEFMVDGFRFDVANELDRHFIRRMRYELKKINPEILLVGEIMHRSEPFLLGDMFDGVMNYYSFELFLKYIKGEWSAQKAANSMAEYRLKINPRIFSCNFNLIGSHDTKRIANLLRNKNLLKLAAVYNLTYQGIPMIYYGDEIGMFGEDDPDCRRGMIWDVNEWDLELFSLYKRLINLKKENKALNCDVVLEKCTDGVLYFKRVNQNNAVYVFFNPSNQDKQITLIDTHLMNKTVKFFNSNIQQKIRFPEISINIPAEHFEILSF